MNSPRRRGGRRPNAGRKRKAGRQRIQLSKEAARTLWVLTKHRRALFNKPELTEEEVVTALIEAAWRDLDEAYQEAAEQAQEPYIY